MKHRKEDLAKLIEGAREGEKFPIAKLISGVERPDSFEFRKNLFESLASQGLTGQNSLTVGFTGTPGAGKSSLLGELAIQFLKVDDGETMAIVAIDPSSISPEVLYSAIEPAFLFPQERKGSTSVPSQVNWN